MMDTLFFQDVREQAVFSPDGPKPHVVVESGNLKALVAGLEPGQQIPPHPEALSVYYFLQGTGTMTVNGERYAAAPGVTLFVPDGGVRGLTADTRLIFLATRVA